MNEQRVAFDGATTYVPRDKLRPVTTALDPGDLAPVGIGTRDAASAHPAPARAPRRVLRGHPRRTSPSTLLVTDHGRSGRFCRIPRPGPTPICSTRRPSSRSPWRRTSCFPWATTARRARMPACGPKHYVQRDLLIGKALVDLLASSLVSPHPISAQLQTDAADSLIASETTSHGGRPT